MAYASPGGPKLVRMDTDTNTIAQAYVHRSPLRLYEALADPLCRPFPAMFIIRIRT